MEIHGQFIEQDVDRADIEVPSLQGMFVLGSGGDSMGGSRVLEPTTM